MPWMSEEPEPEEPKPESRSRKSLRIEAALTFFALLCVAPIILVALVIDAFTRDRALWGDAYVTLSTLGAMWRGEEG